MNGAQSLLRTLVASGVDVCFGNPGTSEMHFVAALDAVPAMRSVLCLFEGITTGAADGYARMLDRPAATLLHLGPGLTNALANVHNARKAGSAMLNIVGEHATYHRAKDAPLSSDIAALAAPLSHWVRCSEAPAALPRDAAEAVAAARTPPGRIATLILPADVSWSECGAPAAPIAPPAAPKVDDARVEAAGRSLELAGERMLLIGGAALTGKGLRLAERVASMSGARLACDTFTARLERGAGRPAVERLPYFAEQAAQALSSVKQLVVIGTRVPVPFFAYPNKPNELLAPDTQVCVLAEPFEDIVEALERLVERCGAAQHQGRVQPHRIAPQSVRPKLDAKAFAETLAALLPEQAIVVDEGGTEGFLAPLLTAHAPPHDWLSNTGGSIGMAVPLAVGAAVACPDRTVIALSGDGGAMYTPQALWTQAREGLRVVNVVLANRSYRILNVELERVGAAEQAGDRTRRMLRIDEPELDFVALAKAMGMSAVRVDSPGALHRELERALSAEGPCLIEVVIQ
jgi:acetolactate synthase-1/2/3 large subunit